MSSSYTFTSPGLSLRSATRIGPSVVRVSFTQPPLGINPAGPNDALNVSNWTVAGRTIVSVAAVLADSQSFDLTVNIPFTNGTWTVAVQNVKTASLVALTSPTTASFAVAQGETALTAGAETDTAFSVIRKHLNAALAGPNWDGLIAALSYADDYLSELARNAFDQLFKSTASGKYLDALAGNDGNSRPVNVGMSDDQFRELAIELSTGRVTYNSILRILQSFFGKEALRAYVDTTTGPFDLADGQTIWFEFEGGRYFFEVDERQFSTVNTATAVELAVAFNLFFQAKRVQALASPVVDPSTGLYKVRVYSPILGLRSKVSVVGGTAQAALKFPTALDVYSGTVTSGDAYSWVYSLASGKTKLSLTTVGIPKINVQSVQSGDYVVVGPDTSIVEGWYSIDSVEYSWSGANYTQTVTLSTNIGYTGSITQQSNSSYSFFRPTAATILSGSRTVVVSETTDGTLDIQVPATAKVSRTVGTGAYVVGSTPVEIVSVERKNGLVTVQTAQPHGLTTGQQVLIDGYRPGIGRAWVDPSTSSILGGSFIHGLNKTANIGGVGDTCTLEPGVEVLSNGDIFVFGGYDTGTNTKFTTVKVTSVFNGTLASNTQATGAKNVDYTIGVVGAGMVLPRYAFASSVLTGPYQDRIFVTGGASTFEGGAVADCEWLVGSSSWAARSSMADARAYHSQVTLNSGDVLVMGGYDTDVFGSATNTCALYQTLLNSWIPVASMNTPRAVFSAYKLSDGKVLVVGGVNSAGRVRDCEIYDPNANTWTSLRAMSQGRITSHSSVQLANGDIFVSDGGPIPFPQETEIYNYDTNTWRRGPPLPEHASFALAKLGTKVYAVPSESAPPIYWMDENELEWRVFPAALRATGRTWIAANGTIALLGGFTGGTSERFFDAIVGDSVASSPAQINGLHKITYVSPNAFTFTTLERSYTSQFGNAGLQRVVTSAYENGWPDVSASRATNVTTLTLAVPEGTSSIFVDSLDANFSSGVKLLTGWTATTVTYAETAANASGTVKVGLVTAVPDYTALRAPDSDIGAFVVDRDSVVYRSSETVTAMSLLAGSSYSILDVTSTATFPDEPGHIILGLGHSYETKPLKYLEKLGPTQILMEPFVADESLPTGVSVTAVQLEGVNSIPRSMWITGSLAARLAAQKNVEDSVASDVILNWQVAYPGDRGLGAEGRSVSDAKTVWGPDDFDEET